MATRAELIATLRQYAQRYGIDEGIAIAQIQQESSFNPSAGSSAGAQGIAQFMPATARRFGVNVWDVNSSFDGWGRYMRWLLDRYNGNYSFALAGYNAGEGNVDKYHGIPPFAETRNYVATILRNAGQVVTSPVIPVIASQGVTLNPIIPNASVFDSGSDKPDPNSIAGIVKTASAGGVLLAVGATVLIVYLISSR